MGPSAVCDYLLLAALASMWGASFAFIKIADGGVTPVTMTAARVVIAFAVLAAVARAAGERMPRPSGRDGLVNWGHFVALGMLGNGIPFTAIAWGEQRVGASLAAILIGVMPVFTVILAHWAGVERLGHPRRLIGLAAGLGGLVVLMGPTAFAGLGGGTVARQAAVALAALSYAATGVYAKALMSRTRMGQLTLAAGLQGGTVLVMVPAALLFEAPWTLAPGVGALAATAALGFVSTGLASIAYFRLLGSAGPTFTGTVNYLIPGIGTVLGVLWLGEAVSGRELAALALILAGVALVRAPRDARLAPAAPR